MKQALSLAFPLLSLLVVGVGLGACEDSSSGSPVTPPGVDGGFVPDGTAATDGGEEPVASKCPVPTGAPIEHSKTVNIDETWGAGLHDVTFDIDIRKDATLTLEPCAVVRIVASRGITAGTANIGDGGKLVAKGKADLPIVIQGKDGARWGSVLVYALGYADLAYVTIKDAGERSSRGGAALHLYGDQFKPIQPLATVDHVTLEGALKYGAVLEGRGAFAPGSQSLTVKGAGDMALRVGGPTLGTIPSGKYTGNTTDAIRIFGSAAGDIIDADVTIRDLGVPYVVGGDGQFNEMSVQGADGTAPVLTIEAGVTLKFGKATSGLFIDRASTTNPSRGVLRALGTAAKPVTFTSNEATPAAGDWTGIHLRGIPNAQTKIDFARVEYAGGDTGTRGFSCGTPVATDMPSNEAAIAIFGQPTSAFVTNTVILKSAANAFERAWTGTPIDFKATNTFTDVAYCSQTFPRPTAAACPDPAPCD